MRIRKPTRFQIRIGEVGYDAFIKPWWLPFWWRVGEWEYFGSKEEALSYLKFGPTYKPKFINDVVDEGEL